MFYGKRDSIVGEDGFDSGFVGPGLLTFHACPCQLVAVNGWFNLDSNATPFGSRYFHAAVASMC